MHPRRPISVMLCGQERYYRRTICSVSNESISSLGDEPAATASTSPVLFR
jgi:hypothetical protein